MWLLCGSTFPLHSIVYKRWVDITFANIDTISISKIQNIGDIDIDFLFTAAFFGLLVCFIIASKVVSDVTVIP